MTPRQAALLRLMQRNPGGLSLMDLITSTAGTYYSVRFDLRALRELGEAGPSSERGAGVVWAATADLEAIKARRAAERAAQAAAAKERTQRREQTAAERAAEEAACEAFASPPVHRVLEQDDWTGRAPTRGVASIFHMGSSLA